MSKTKVVGFKRCNHCDQVGYIFVGDLETCVAEVFEIVSKQGARRVLALKLKEAGLNHSYARMIEINIRSSKLPDSDPILQKNNGIRIAHMDLYKDIKSQIETAIREAKATITHANRVRLVAQNN